MAEGSQFGAFIPTTDVYDISQGSNIDANSDDFRLFLVRLRQSINNVALVTNIKDSGYYLPAEFINGQLYFPNPDLAVTNPGAKNATYRQVYRIAVDFRALPNAGSKSVAHAIPNINVDFTFTRMYGAASDPVAFSYLPLPNSDIHLSADATNVTVTTVADLTAYTRTYIILEYLKD